LEECQVDLALPRFAFSSPTISLRAPLEELGLRLAFSGLADLSGISQQQGLKVEDVLHQATVAVDEAGTEAAAATVVQLGLLSMPSGRPARMVVDRPFVLLIRDQVTRTLLFLGRVTDPRS